METILGNTRKPDVTFYKNGRIDLTSRIAKMLNLGNGDVIDIGLCNGEYMLYVRLKNAQVVGNHEARCYTSKRNSHNFRAYSKKLCNAILSACGANKAQLASGVAVEVEALGTAIPLITRNNLYND